MPTRHLPDAYGLFPPAAPGLQASNYRRGQRAEAAAHLNGGGGGGGRAGGRVSRCHRLPATRAPLLSQAAATGPQRPSGVAARRQQRPRPA